MIKKLLITGANGMLGGTLCRVFRKKYKVYGLHRDDSCYSACDEDISIDLRSIEQLTGIISKINPDIIIHTAGLTSIELCERHPETAFEENVSVSAHISRVCPTDCCLIYLSTDQVYGEVKERRETTVSLKPVNQYGSTKYLAELETIKNHSNSVVVRTNIFGWNLKPGKTSSAEWIYHALKERRKINLFSDYLFSPVYSQCLGEILLRIVDRKFVGIINIGSPVPCSKFEFGKTMASIAGLDFSFVKEESMISFPSVARRAKDLTLNTDKATAIGLNIPTYQESLRRFLSNAE